MNFTIECEQEVDGRWIAEVPQLPGNFCYGRTAGEATAEAKAFALRIVIERVEHGESKPVERLIAPPYFS